MNRLQKLLKLGLNALNKYIINQNNIWKLHLSDYIIHASAENSILNPKLLILRLHKLAFVWRTEGLQTCQIGSLLLKHWYPLFIRSSINSLGLISFNFKLKNIFLSTERERTCYTKNCECVLFSGFSDQFGIPKCEGMPEVLMSGTVTYFQINPTCWKC